MKHPRTRRRLGQKSRRTSVRTAWSYRPYPNVNRTTFQSRWLTTRVPLHRLRRWDSWNQQVTDAFYKNVCGTHAEIATLLQCETNRGVLVRGPVQLQRFENAVMSELLFVPAPTPRRDDILWQNFTDLLRTSLDVSNEQVEKFLSNHIFCKTRQSGDSVYSFALEYKLAAGNFNQVSRTNLTEHNYVHFMTNALNLTGYHMLEIRLKLVDTKNHGCNMSDIPHVISIETFDFGA
jgi:hypothetical protein